MGVFLGNCRRLVNESKPVQRIFLKNALLPLLLCLLFCGLSAFIGGNFNYSQNYFFKTCSTLEQQNRLYVHRPWPASKFSHIDVWRTQQKADQLSSSSSSERARQTVVVEVEREREKRMNNQRLWAAFFFLTEVTDSFYLNWFSFKWTKQGGKHKILIQKWVLRNRFPSLWGFLFSFVLFLMHLNAS